MSICYLKLLVYKGTYSDCAEEIKVSGFSSLLDGIYHKQSRRGACAGHPLYGQIENSNYVIAWSGDFDFSHWVLTDQAHAGTSIGFAWFRQDQDEHCPGIGEVIVYEAGTNMTYSNVRIESLDATGKKIKTVCIKMC